MNPRSITIYRTYQTSTHRTLGFYSGEEDSVLRFCHLKYDVEIDDIALERVPVRKVTRSEVVCFSEVMDQLNDHKERIRNAENKNLNETVVEAIIGS